MDRELGPPVLVGEKVFWLGNSHDKPVCGVVKWIGNIPEINLGWCVGIELDVALPGLECNGYWKNRKLFECRAKHGLIAPIEEIQKIYPKNKFSSIENNLRLHLDDSQFKDFVHSYLRGKSTRETPQKDYHSRSEVNPIHESFKNRKPNPEKIKKVDRRNTTELLRDTLNNRKPSKQKEKPGRKNSRKSERNLAGDSGLLNSFTDFNEILENAQTLDLKTCISEPIINMNEIAGYFKEIKEGDERSETQNKMDDLELYGTTEATEPGQSKPKKLFSFLKWFNKKQKHDPNLKLFKEASAASSPMFPRKQTSSCESIDTIFSTQTVRSFAYIPPTQYVPSAPPLEFDKSSFENLREDKSSRKCKSEETESIYERKKKRKAPEPPRLSRENSLPTTLERKTSEDEDFDGIKSCHRRTVSESFKDKKAGAYCHVQGKRKAPLPPGSALYPNLQKLDNQYPSLYKKKKPAPPPPALNLKNQNLGETYQNRKDAQNESDISRPNEEVQKEKLKESKDDGVSGKEEKGVKISQTSKVRLTKDSSLSPLPSRPWYKRNHRDSTGSNIIRKDLLKGFDRKKNRESDDWMPEVGFSRRSLSTESGHNKFNIFSKLEKTEDKKKEEKRKSQISILTNISELDREAAEIVRKEQAEEKKMMAANDDKYYSPKENVKAQPADEKERCNGKTKNASTKSKAAIGEQERKCNDNILKVRTIFNDINTKKEVKDDKNQTAKDEQPKVKEDKIKGKENHSVAEGLSKEQPKPRMLSTNTQADLTNPVSQSSAEKVINPSQNSSQARLNHFNVENKKLNYLNEPWVCKKCTLENPGWRVFCEICNSVKPRFLFNHAVPSTDAPKEKDRQQDLQKPREASEKLEKLKESNPEKNTNQALEETPQVPEDEKEEGKPGVILDELRKKRMTFFTSKLGTLPESGKTERDTVLGNNNDAVSEETGNFPTKDKQEVDSLIGPVKENIIGGAVMKDRKKEKVKSPEGPEESAVSKETPKTIAVPAEQNANDDSNCGVSESHRPSEESQVIEAYVVTKTVVLEDIIVKKPERGRKVSASVQTKSKLSTPPEAKIISPPPRTKKIVFDAATEAKTETEAQSHSGNELKKMAESQRQEEIEKLTNRLTQAEGVADFRANIETMAPNTEMNTVAVNRLLRKLETAINCGDHFVAGGLAKELALMKINCSVTRQVTPSPSTSNIIIDLYIEDKVSHQGPIPIEVSPAITVLQLKNKIQQELGIPLEVQRWILGKKLAMDDGKTLEAEGVKSNRCPVFLYLVAPGNQKTNATAFTKSEKLTPSEEPHPGPEPARGSSPGSKRKGLYYNHEEDRDSYCEDSEEDKKSSSPVCCNEGKETITPIENFISNTDSKNADAEVGIKMEGNPTSVFDLKSRDTESDIEKELKLISANSVKQKVEKLNKTFVENATAVKPPLRHSRSPETWKCGACHFVNSPGKLNCSSCNVKKVFSGPFSRNPEGEKKLAKEDLLKKENEKPTNRVNIHYKALIELQDADLVPNNEPFNCSICLTDYASGEGVTLKDCLHTFCRTCLISTVQFSEDAEVKCPYLDETYSCQSVLQQREIKALVPRGIFELHLAKSVKEAENKINNAFHCKTPDCKGWCIYEDNVNEFHCPVCKATNCLTCQAVHSGINCREFQERMKVASETDGDAKKTTDMLNEMVEKGEAMACPKCQVVLMKKWGCDWLKCSMCKTEICWVTRGFRWGTEGKGDISGGCKCGVNGVKCHPKYNPNSLDKKGSQKKKIKCGKNKKEI